jgi:hypothetical protein
MCRQHCIYYLIHRYRGYSMTNITGLLKNPKEATDIVKTIVYINKIPCSPSRLSGSVFLTSTEGAFNCLGNLFLAYTPLNTNLVPGWFFRTSSISMNIFLHRTGQSRRRTWDCHVHWRQFQGRILRTDGTTTLPSCVHDFPEQTLYELDLRHIQKARSIVWVICFWHTLL